MIESFASFAIGFCCCAVLTIVVTWFATREVARKINRLQALVDAYRGNGKATVKWTANCERCGLEASGESTAIVTSEDPA